MSSNSNTTASDFEVLMVVLNYLEQRGWEKTVKALKR